MRWRVAILGLAVLAVLCTAALLAAQRRQLAEAWLLSRLQANGIENASLRVSRLGPGGARIADLRLGDGLSVERIDARWSPSGLAARRVDRVELAGALLKLRVSEDGIALQGLETVPRRAGPASPAAVPALPFRTARLEAVRVRVDTPLGPLPELLVEGRASSQGTRLEFAVSARDDDERIALRAEGRHDLAAGGGTLDAELEPVEFAPDGLQPAQLVPALAPWLREASGTLAARGSARWQQGGLATQLDLAFADWSLATPLARIEGLNGALRLAPAWPPQSPAAQELSVARLDFGLELSDGLLSYRLLPDRKLDLEGAEWSFAGGRVHTAGPIDLAAEEQALVLQLGALQLEQLLELAPLDGLSGEGVLSGRLPLVRRQGVLEIQGGVLTGEPPGGWIRYEAAGAGAAAMAGAYGVDVLLGALENLNWSSLELRIDGDTAGDVVIELHVAGHNPAYESGRPVEFNLSVESRLVDLLSRSAASYRIPATIERRLGELGLGSQQPTPRPVPSEAVDSGTRDR